MKKDSVKKSDLVTDFFKLTIGHLPRRHMSRWAGWLVRQNLPFGLTKKSVHWFVKRFEIDMSEAEKDISAYKNISELFVRKLKPGLRPIGKNFVHPADSVLVDGGVISSDQLIQAKDKFYSLKELVGDLEWAHDVLGGRLLTYYLSPRDYHHVHSPIDGQLLAQKNLGVDLWPVNPWSLSKHERVFCENERLIVKAEVQQKTVLIIMVGAVVVGKMKLSFDVREKPVSISRGDPFGTFLMGSTVLVLYGKDLIPDNSKLNEGLVKYGESLIKLT